MKSATDGRIISEDGRPESRHWKRCSVCKMTFRVPLVSNGKEPTKWRLSERSTCSKSCADSARGHRYRDHLGIQ